MNFELSEEQRLLQETVSGFLAAEASPAHVRAFYDGDEAVDAPLWKGLCELGLPGLMVPEAYGGAGLQLLDLACVAEVLGRHATPGPLLGHALATLAIACGGSDAQRSRWLPRLASGEVLATVAFADAGGWQPGQWTLEAPQEGRLYGRKRHVPCGRAADLVVAGLAPQRLALLEVRSGGVEATPEEGIDRTRRLDALDFDGARFEWLSAAPDVAERVRDAGLVLLAADAAGGACRCVEVSVAYAGEREQFGTTIAHFQALKHQLADLALDAEPCVPLYWYAAHAFDAGISDAPLAAAIAKSHNADRFLRVARGAVEAHGGIAYTWECEVHWWLKRAVFDRAFLGTPRDHRERAARLQGW